MSGELVTKTEPCLSVMDQVKGLPGLSTDEIERTSREKLGLCRAPLAVRTYRTGAKALLCQSRADDGYGWVAPKPCGRIGRERRLCRVKAVRTMAMAGSRQSRADVDYGWVAPKPCTNERTGQKAEAKMGVNLSAAQISKQ